MNAVGNFSFLPLSAGSVVGGSASASYLPYCFFNLLSPVLDVIYGFIGFKVRELAPEDESSLAPAEQLADA